MSILKIFIGSFLLISSLHANVLQIMPLGDSITYDDKRSDYELVSRPSSMRSGYRNHLWYMLQEASISVNFVGSQVAGQAVEPAFDPDNEGHPDWTSYDISNSVYQFLSANHADTILLHIGSNDRSTSVAGINAILDDIDQYEANTGRPVRVMVALIIGRNIITNTLIQGFNSNLYNLLQRRINDGDMLTVVDMFTNAGLISTDYSDITHPNDTGYQKMATVWFNALSQPYNVSLHSFPRSLVPSGHIGNVSVDENAKQVSFVTSVPDTGIQF